MCRGFKYKWQGVTVATSWCWGASIIISGVFKAWFTAGSSGEGTTKFPYLKKNRFWSVFWFILTYDVMRFNREHARSVGRFVWIFQFFFKFSFFQTVQKNGWNGWNVETADIDSHYWSTFEIILLSNFHATISQLKSSPPFPTSLLVKRWNLAAESKIFDARAILSVSLPERIVLLMLGNSEVVSN